MATQNLLLPYNFTHQDQKALDFVIQTFASQEHFEITLFNVYTPVPEINSAQNPILEKMKANLLYLSQVIMERKEALEHARQHLVSHGFADGHVQAVYRPRKKEIAAEIVGAALENKSTLVVLSRRPGKVSRFFTGSIFSKVVPSLKGVTICIVS